MRASQRKGPTINFFSSRGGFIPRLGKEFVDGFSERQDRMRSSAVVEVLLGDVDAQMAVHGGENVLRAHRAFLGLGPLGIGSSHDSTPLDAATSHRGAENIRIMVSSAGDIYLGGPAKLTPGDDHDVIG